MAPKLFLIVFLVAGASFAQAQTSAPDTTPSASSPSATTGAADSTSHHTLLTPADLKWENAPPALPAGAKIAVLDGDPTKPGPFTIRLKTPSGYKVPPHTHPTAERITVISGIFRLGTGATFDQTVAKALTRGGFVVMPAGMQHFASTKGETIVQVSADGPFVIDYVNPKDDPRQAKP